MTPDITQQPREFCIPARLQDISVVRRAVAESARQACLGEDEANDLILAASEACANAIQHGAGEDETADISIRIFTAMGVVGVEIHDPGPGFDPAELWTPSGKRCGHGIMLILHLSDTVHYICDTSGTTVSITKYAGSREGCAPNPLNEGSGSLDFDARHSSRIAYLFDVCRAVSGTLDLRTVLHLVTERTARYFNVPSARVLLHDTRKQTATLAASWGEEIAKASLGKEGHPRSARVSLSVPILSRGKVVGSIHLDSRQPARSFTHADVAALRAIAAQAAVAIENARLYRESQTRVEQLAALGEVACSLNASLDLDHTLHTILDKTRELLGVELCAVMLLDGDGYLSVRAAHGMSEEYINCQRALLQESPLARALKEKRVIAAWDLRPYDAPRGRYEGVVSAAAAPMLLNAAPIGVLNIYTRERHQFSKDQLRVLRALADYAALAVHNARLYEDCMQARAEVAAWQERTDKAREAAEDLHEVIRLVAELAAQAMGADGGALVLPDVKLLAGVETPNLTAADLATLPGIELLAREVQQRRHPLILEDVQSLPAGQRLREAGVAACLAVPLPTQEDMNAVLCVYSRSARQFGAREYALLSSFAAQAATIIENQRLLQDAHLRLEEMNTLLEVSQSIVSKLDPEAVFDRIIQHGSRIMQAEVCSLLLVDRQTGELRVAAARGLDEQHVQRLRLSQGEGVIGAVLRDGQARAVTDIRRHPNFVYQDVTEPQGLRALLCVPLQTAEEVLGVLNVYRGAAHAWSDAEVKFLSALGVQAAIAIENATLYQQEHQIAQALQKAFVPVHPPVATGLEIGRVYVPANAQGEVGGDYYDFIPLDNGRMGFVIADVSGKGLRAATDTAMGKYVLRAYLLENPLPGEVVRRTNNALRRQFQEDCSFLTLFYGLWDPEESSLSFVNAGHPYPLLWQQRERRCLRLRSDRTMLLGIMDDADFTEQALQIKPGDVLLAYTDGVIEARRGNELFGMTRLEKTLGELVAEPAQIIADEIYRRACQFRDEPRSDDVTLVVLKFQG